MKPSQYTDYLGNPIKAGDTIVYPSAQGSAAADLFTGEVIEILPLIPTNLNNVRDGSAATHADIQHGRFSGRYIPIVGDRDERARDMSKAFILKVRRTRKGYRRPVGSNSRPVTLTNVERVVVVTPLVRR